MFLFHANSPWRVTSVIKHSCVAEEWRIHHSVVKTSFYLMKHEMSHEWVFNNRSGSIGWVFWWGFCIRWSSGGTGGFHRACFWGEQYTQCSSHLELRQPLARWHENTCWAAGWSRPSPGQYVQSFLTAGSDKSASSLSEAGHDGDIEHEEEEQREEWKQTEESNENWADPSCSSPNFCYIELQNPLLWLVNG